MRIFMGDVSPPLVVLRNRDPLTSDRNKSLCRGEACAPRPFCKHLQVHLHHQRRGGLPVRVRTQTGDAAALPACALTHWLRRGGDAAAYLRMFDVGVSLEPACPQAGR